MKYLILLFIVAVYTSDVIQMCHLESLGQRDNEEKFATHFNVLMRKGVDIPYECLQFLVERGFYKTSVDLYEKYFIINQIDVSQQLQALIDQDESLTNNQELQHIFKHSIYKSSKLQTVQPVIQWAQSRNHTLINIKFALRIDAPACLNVKIEDIRIEGDKVILSAFGVVSHHPIRYETTINLYKPINISLSSFKHEAVGTMFFNLTKVDPNDLWIRLTTSDLKVPIWWDLTDNLKDDMDEFVKMLENESDKKDKSSAKKYRKQQKLKEKEKEKQERIDREQKVHSSQLERNQCYYIRYSCENGWFGQSIDLNSD